MKIIVDGRELSLVDANVTIAKASVNTFLDTIRRGAEAHDNEALFLTTLIVMYQKSGELLDELGIENLQYVLEQYYEATASTEE